MKPKVDEEYRIKIKSPGGGGMWGDGGANSGLPDAEGGKRGNMGRPYVATRDVRISPPPSQDRRNSQTERAFQCWEENT